MLLINVLWAAAHALVHTARLVSRSLALVLRAVCAAWTFVLPYAVVVLVAYFVDYAHKDQLRTHTRQRFLFSYKHNSRPQPLPPIWPNGGTRPTSASRRSLARTLTHRPKPAAYHTTLQCANAAAARARSIVLSLCMIANCAYKHNNLIRFSYTQMAATLYYVSKRCVRARTCLCTQINHKSNACERRFLAARRVKRLMSANTSAAIDIARACYVLRFHRAIEPGRVRCTL